MVYVGGRDEQDQAFEVRDPLATTLTAALAKAGAAPGARVAALLGIEAVFGRDLNQSQEFRRVVTAAYRQLNEVGARKAVAACASLPAENRTLHYS
jgi:fructuronate reductase